jgi:hypothetical protein
MTHGRGRPDASATAGPDRSRPTDPARPSRGPREPEPGRASPATAQAWISPQRNATNVISLWLLALSFCLMW